LSSSSSGSCRHRGPRSWKADEPYGLGIVNQIVRTGDWVVPAVADVPFLEKASLYYLGAAAFVSVLSPPLAPHDAARLVNVSGCWWS